jgi:hypothetical protein
VGVAVSLGRAGLGVERGRVGRGVGVDTEEGAPQAAKPSNSMSRASRDLPTFVIAHRLFQTYYSPLSPNLPGIQPLTCMVRLSSSSVFRSSSLPPVYQTSMRSALLSSVL